MEMNRSQMLRLGRARKTVWSGNYQTALPILQKLASETATAHASLAEIYGFLFEWKKVLHHVSFILADPLSVNPDNVFTDMIELTGRAARETGDWQALNEYCERALESIARRSEVKEKSRYDFILRNLKAYAGREGTAPHELVCIFATKNSPSPQQMRADYENAFKNAELLRPNLRGRPAALLQHQISLAFVFEQWETATKLYETNGAPLYHFDYVFPIIKYHAQNGQTTQARQLILRHLPLWMPLGRTAIAPVALLTDADVQGVVDVDFCRQILRMPRAI